MPSQARSSGSIPWCRTLTFPLSCSRKCSACSVSYRGRRSVPISIPVVHVCANFNFATVGRTQCQYYGHKRSRTTSVATFLAALVVFASFEAGMIYAVKVSESPFSFLDGGC